MSKIFNIEQLNIYNSICGVTEKKKKKKKMARANERKACWGSG